MAGCKGSHRRREVGDDGGFSRWEISCSSRGRPSACLRPREQADDCAQRQAEKYRPNANDIHRAERDVFRRQYQRQLAAGFAGELSRRKTVERNGGRRSELNGNHQGRGRDRVAVQGRRSGASGSEQRPACGHGKAVGNRSVGKLAGDRRSAGRGGNRRVGQARDGSHSLPCRFVAQSARRCVLARRQISGVFISQPVVGLAVGYGEADRSPSSVSQCMDRQR